MEESQVPANQEANVLFFDNHKSCKGIWTTGFWPYGYRTNVPNMPNKKPEGRWQIFTCEELFTCDRANFNGFRFKVTSLAASINLPSPDDLVEVIIKNLEAGLSSFKNALIGLRKTV